MPTNSTLKKKHLYPKSKENTLQAKNSNCTTEPNRTSKKTADIANNSQNI